MLNGYQKFSFCTTFFIGLMMFGCDSSSGSLDARVGTLEGESLSGSAASKLHLARNYNSSISDLSAEKDMEKGIILIKFDFSNPGCLSCQFLIRLFDKNGNYLTQFLSENHNKLFGFGAANDKTKKPITLSYPVNLRDLKEAEKLEFGFAVMM